MRKILRQLFFLKFFSSTRFAKDKNKMSTNIVQQMKTILSSDSKKNLSQRPSSMEDTNDCLLKANEKKNFFKIEEDLNEEDRFRACFIDCSCDCSVSLFHVLRFVFELKLSKNKSCRIIRTRTVPSQLVELELIYQLQFISNCYSATQT